MAAAKKTVEVPSNVLVLDSPEAIAELEEREDFFAIAGKVYTIQKHAPANLTNDVLEMAAEKNFAVALDFALKEMIGQDGFDALRSCKTLTSENLNKLTKIVIEKVMGTLAADPKENDNTTTPEK